MLREDNADLRLRETGYKLGLIDKETWEHFLQKKASIEHGVSLLHSTRIRPTSQVNDVLVQLGSVRIKQPLSLANLLRRPEITLASLREVVIQADIPINMDLDNLSYGAEIEMQVKYEGYIKRQEEQVIRFKKLENTLLPTDIQYDNLPGLSNEVVEKLNRIQPLSLGQASRISGMTPAAISVLQVHLKKQGYL